MSVLSQPADVEVIEEGQDALRQPPTFRLCPLGMQFSSDHPIEEFKVIELTIDVPVSKAQPPEKVTCCGVVVHCRPETESATFRIWTKFIDLPEEVRKRIENLSRESDLLCDHCLNFREVCPECCPA